MAACVRWRTDGGIARIALSNPGKFNAMSCAMWHELRQVCEALAQRQDLRVVVVAGEGGHFCAGGDIAEYGAFRFDTDSLRDFHENLVWGGLSALLALELPLVAQIEGNCMGAGVEIASCCDIRVAGQSARFGAPIAKLGFPMAPREAELVARELGLATARQMLLEAAVLDAPTLLARGFLHTVLPDADVCAEVHRRAQHMAQLAPQAARQNKQTLRALASGLGVAALLPSAYDYADSAEHREGIGAFLAKRPPRF